MFPSKQSVSLYFSFYSDDEFDPAKYQTTQSDDDDDLLASPDRDLPKINVNFTVKKVNYNFNLVKLWNMYTVT